MTARNSDKHRKPEMKVSQKDKAKKIIEEQMWQEDFQRVDSYSAYSESLRALRAVTDQADIFARANRLLVDSDLEKKKRGKRTRRYPISPLFVRATGSLETIGKCLATLKLQVRADL